MDHNEFLGAHQVALMKADAATHEDARRKHLEDATIIAGLVESLDAERADGARPLTANDRKPPTREVLNRRGGVSRWEDEGGAVKEPAPAKAPPIKARSLIEFSVGPHRYSSITDALAQQARIARGLADQ